MDRKIVLTFNTDAGKYVSITIPYAKDATAAEVKEAMDSIIATEILDYINGNLTSANSAKIITTEYTDCLLN